MKTTSSPHRRATRSLGVIVATSVVFGLLSSIAISAPPETPKSEKRATSSAAAATKPEIAKTRDVWRKSMSQLPKPKPGCYMSSFPRVEWKPVACGAPPPYPMPPAHGRRGAFVVGNGTDYAANPTTATINAVESSFPSLSNGITESGPIANSGPTLADTYTLQINTNQFTSGACAGSPNPNCKGWEQFVYENNNSSHRVFIQYWLIQYNAACPPNAGWTQFSFSGGTEIYCYQSTSTASLPAGVPASKLGNVTLSASVTSTSDQVTVSDGTHAVTRVGNNATDAAAGWTDAEFNVFGDGGNSSGGGQAGFGTNSTIKVKTVVHNGATNAPTCSLEGFTGETNNLALVGTPNITIQPSPTIEFNESNAAGGAVASCATAAGVGDTHLSTFGGLLYDFQASGDFVLAQMDKDFIVEARQVSGAPTWPNASINKAVATRMGETRVAVCTSPSRLEVDGAHTEVSDGKTLSLPSGVDILHTGNVYVVADQSGNSMRAEVNDTYINVSVGLGHWPAKVRGILANANGRVNQIEASNGAVLTSPFSVADLYHRYADSWRVSAKESLLSVCGGREIESGIPKKPFYANDLDPKAYKRARAVCTAAGVKVKALLDACTLDVAVIGRDTAAKVFVGLRAPAAMGRVVSSSGDHDDDHKRSR